LQQRKDYAKTFFLLEYTLDVSLALAKLMPESCQGNYFPDGE